MKTKLGQATLKKVKEWLKKSDNSEVKLAHLLGYKTPVTITQWVKKGHVPSREVVSVMNAIQGRLK
jgi:hypothetical protein